MTTRPTISVRVATPSDADAIGAVLRSSYPTLLPSHYDENLLAPILPLVTRPNPRLLACGTFYVAASPADELVGCGGWTQEHPGTGEIAEGIAHIRHFATHPNWTRKGVARAIMERCCRDAEARGVVALYCYATLSGEAFYRASGFRTMATAGVLMGSSLPFQTVVMRRNLV